MKSYKNCTIIITIIMLLLLSHSIILANNIKINMNFKGADIRDVLRTIAELADVNLVTDGSVDGDITIRLKNLSFDDSLKLITQAHDLAYKWYENTVVVATSKRIDQIYANVMVKTVDINHADLKEIQAIVMEVYPDLGITLDQRNGNLIIKGKDEEINAAEELIRKLDTHREEVTEIIPVPAEKSEFLQNYIQKVYPDLVVEYDDSGNFVIYGSPYDTNSANLLISKLVEQLKIKGDTIVSNLPVNVIQSIKIKHLDVEYINEQISKMYPDVNIIADSINNQLIYNGSNKSFQEIKQIVETIDLESFNKVQDEEYFDKIIRIQYADVDTIKSVLQEISPSLNVKLLTGTKQILIKGNEKDVKMAISIAGNLDKEKKKVTEIASIDYASIEDIKGIISDLYPDISFKFNSQNKEIVINGNEKDVKDVLSLINKVDMPRKQIIIEVRVEEVSTRDLSEMGINSDQMSGIEIIDKNDDGFIDGVGLTFADFIKFVETRGTSNTLANPRLMTLSGEEATMLIGNRIPVPVETVQDGQVVSSIEFIEAGINLIFTPWVTKDNKINLEVKPQVSTIGESIGTSLPPINTREIETNIRLNNGETFAIGGLIQDDIIESVSKVPLLAEIPIFGELFKSRKIENFKTELIIFITPYIVNEDSLNSVDDEIESVEQSITEDTQKINEEKKVSVNDEDKEEYKDNEIDVIIDNNKIGEDSKQKEFKTLTKEELDAILGLNEKSQKIHDSSKKIVVVNKNDDLEYSQDQNEEISEVVDNETSEIFENKEELNDIQDMQIDSNDKEIRENEIVNNQETIIINDSDQEKSNAVVIDFTELYLYNYKLNREVTIKELAEKFGVKEEFIIEANKENEATVGSYIRIPIPKSRIYIFKKGDTLWKIHSLYNISIDMIKELNSIENENNIAVGAEIVIPATKLY